MDRRELQDRRALPATRPYTLRLDDVAYEAGYRPSGSPLGPRLDPDEFFNHCRPSEVLAAYDRLRQNELDHQQGRAVQFEISERHLRFVRTLVEGHLDRATAQDAQSEQTNLTCRQITDLLAEIDTALDKLR